MNFPPDTHNYMENMRSLLQQRSQAAAHLGQPNGHVSPPEIYNPTASLAKMMRNPSSFSNGGSMTSVIQSPISSLHSHYSNSPNKSSSYEDLLAETRRHSIPNSMGSTGSGSSISPASSAEHHDDVDESPPMVPTPVVHDGGRSASPVVEEPDDGIPPDTPRSGLSEYHDSIASEADFEARRPRADSFADHHPQILHRKGSILQYCLRNPGVGPLALHGGSDAEADHTSTSPGSSDLQDEVAISGPFNCQVCEFTSNSKFHFNSHMNTHCVHRCPIPECNYSTRTEGRLRRHVKNHHNPPEDEHFGEDGLDDLHEVSMSSGDPMNGTPNNPGSASSSSNKAKSYRCKQCHDFVATTKDESYDHQRLHIKPEKLLVCPLANCRFVTEYKHHLEYHVRNHSGSKPFKCTQQNCNYTCVNKSMLNSHMKSHSNFYQFKCECGYATKYCHSLKQHLKKYQHKATNNGPESAQLSMAGSPQPIQIIQAPSPKPHDKPPKRRRNNNNRNAIIQSPTSNGGSHAMGGFSGYVMPGSSANGGMAIMSPVDGHPPPMGPGFPYGLYPGPMNQLQQVALYQNMLLSAAAANGMIHPAMYARQQQHQHQLQQQQERQMRVGSPDSGLVKRESPSPDESEQRVEPYQAQSLQEMLAGRRHNGVLRMLPQSRVIRSTNEVLSSSSAPLDLSGGKENGSNGSSERQSESPKSDASSGNLANEVSSSRRRRKGPAFKLDLAVRQRLQDSLPEEEEEECSENMNGFSVVRPASPSNAFVKEEPKMNGTRKLAETRLNGAKRQRKFECVCHFCGLGFEDSTMFSMHMGFHSRDDPYTCGLCGHQAADKITFFLHITKAPHY